MALDTEQVVGSTTISGVSYPIFGTRDRATEYLRASVQSDDYFALGPTDQSKFLVSAKRWLDRQSWLDGFPVQSNTLVPLGIEFAQYELALVLVEDPTQFNSRDQGSNEKYLKAGSVEIEFFSGTSGSTNGISGAPTLPPQALDLITDYLGSRTRVIAPTVGGLENKSNILGVDQFGLNEPL